MTAIGQIRVINIKPNKFPKKDHWDLLDTLILFCCFHA